MQCHACHSIEGKEMPIEGPNILNNKVILGGKTYTLKSYGELVTAIMDPGHSIASRYLATLPEAEKEEKIESPMVVYNDDMTVQELVDLAAFLHSLYVKVPYHYTNPYPYYY